MIKSILTKNQKNLFSKEIRYNKHRCRIYVKLRYDDECGNGHNTFSITGSIKDLESNNLDNTICAGCIHNEIKKYFPEFAHLIKWHLCSSDGPIHYIANTLYWASGSASTKYKEVKERDFKNARASAIWEDATDEQLSLPSEELKKLLLKRLPKLMKEFRKDIKNLEFTY